MPFKSEAQRRFMYSRHPELAKEFENATPKGANLPEHVKKMADGGTTAGNPAELDAPAKDATASDFLLPFLLGPSAKGMAEDLPAALEGLGETGEVTLGRAAPEMEGTAISKPDVEVYVKGIQKNPNGPDIVIRGVKGKPEEIAKLGYGPDPGSIPDSVLQRHGLLPSAQVNMPGQAAPNAYAKGGYASPGAVNLKPSSTTPTPIFAEGGKVERSSLAHPVPNAMMARAMDEGGYPHVTFMENQTPEEKKKTTHLAASPHMAKGGIPESGPSIADLERQHQATLPLTNMNKPGVKAAPGGDVHVNRESHMSMPIVSKDTEFHLRQTPEQMKQHEVGKEYKVALPMTLTSQEGDMERFKTHGDAKVEEPKDELHMAEGGKTPHFLEGLKKGALHKQLGVSEDKNIPEKKLTKAADSDNETLRKRAQFAINAKKWHHAAGGVIPHEEKMKAIYKAMGIKKYADGGVSTSDGTVDPSQLPTPPNPSDPSYWDQIKAALQQVASPITGAASAVAAPVQAATNAAMPLVPPTVSAVNQLTGANLPVPAGAAPANMPPTPAAAAPAVDQNFIDKLNAGTALTPPTSPPAKPPVSPLPAGMPNLGNIFNQDTSALTAGVNPEDRQALANKLQAQQHGLGSIIAQAVAGLGDALAAKGGKEQHSLQNIFSMQKTQRDEALANFDAARQDRVQKLALQTQMGDNALKQAAAADAYGVDNNLNKLIGAPTGTMKKDLPTYFSLMSAQVAKQEKDADLYLKAHSQAADQIASDVKNASELGFKPSAEQIQARGEQLAGRLIAGAKGLYHTATNPQTGHKIESYDGGMSWRDAGAK